MVFGNPEEEPHLAVLLEKKSSTVEAKPITFSWVLGGMTRTTYLQDPVGRPRGSLGSGATKAKESSFSSIRGRFAAAGAPESGLVVRIFPCQCLFSPGQLSSL